MVAQQLHGEGATYNGSWGVTNGVITCDNNVQNLAWGRPPLHATKERNFAFCKLAPEHLSPHVITLETFFVWTGAT